MEITPMLHFFRKTIVLVLLVGLVLATAACALHYSIHPGALNVTDSVTYDSLLVAKAAIDEARVDDEAGHLPAEAKDALNTLIDAYNLARDTWLTYRVAITSNEPAALYGQRLNKDLTNLVTAIQVLRGKEVKR
jgi:hypothetical protein